MQKKPETSSSSVSASRATAQRSTSTRPRPSSQAKRWARTAASGSLRASTRSTSAASSRSSSAPGCSGDRDGRGRPGRPHRRRVFRPAGALTEGAARGDRAGREGGRRDLRARPRQADQRYGGDADVNEHDGRGVPVLRRGDRREGHGRPGARGGARCAAQLADLARLRARRGRRAGRGARDGADRRAGVQAP